MEAISSAPATCILGFRRGLPNRMEASPVQYSAMLSPLRPVPRLTIATGLQLKKHRVLRLSASETPNSSTSKEGRSSSSSGSDPPLPTILAGLLVFLLVLWVLSSLFMWLVGLILHPPSR